MQKGFTLIEILIVVAIIAILASVVLIGLGPTQQSGRDARRLSDLSQAQNGIELYYQKCGYYPGGVNANACSGYSQTASWANLTAAITGSNIGIAQFPNDPTAGKMYYYQSYGPNGESYVIGAKLENPNNTVWGGGYTAPANIPSGMTSCLQAAQEYCKSL
jgi:prepilin-type N-terminal cleavage/methylation domain-containing protein